MSPTTLAGTTAPLPYQLELPAITAVINRMKQCNKETSVQTNSLTHPTSSTQLVFAALSAAIAKMENKRLTVPPQLAELCLPESAPTLTSATANLLHDNDDGNHPHDVQCQPLSLTATFKLQVQMMHTINMLLVKLNYKVTYYSMPPLAPKPAHSLAIWPTCSPQQPHTQSATQLPFSPTNTFQKPRFHLGLCTMLTPAPN